MTSEVTYVVVDGENIDATLGLSVLGRRPDPEERPRWNRLIEYTRHSWSGATKGLFFLNASSGHMPMSFVQALMAMDYTPIPLSGPAEEKVVDIGIQRMLEAIADSGQRGNVILTSHDADFRPQIEELLAGGHRVGVICFREFLASGLAELIDSGLEIIDIEHDVRAFQVALPRLQIISVDDFDPTAYL